MIGHTVLREIVGPNFSSRPPVPIWPRRCALYFPLPRAAFAPASARAQDRQRSFLVFDLTATILTTHDCACRNVQHLHGRIGRVHALPTRAARARDFNSQIFRLQFEIDVFRFGQDRDCRGRCMNATLRLSRRHALHTMNAAFVTRALRKTDSPETRKIASLNPPSSDGLDSRSSVLTRQILHSDDTSGKGRRRKWPLRFRPFRLGFPRSHRGLHFRLAAATRFELRVRDRPPAFRGPESRRRRSPRSQHRADIASSRLSSNCFRAASSSSHFASSCLMLACSRMISPWLAGDWQKDAGRRCRARVDRSVRV